MARPLRLEWSAGALSDLDRFARFLRQRAPKLADIVATEIVAKTRILSEQPESGRVIGRRMQYRQIVLQVLNAKYVFQYRYDAGELVILRVFHIRERRS